MKVLKESSDTGKKLASLEDFLCNLGITINGIEYISVNGASFYIKDCYGNSNFGCLPRTFDSEKFVLIEKE
jgi:hypothetical protein